MKNMLDTDLAKAERFRPGLIGFIYRTDTIARSSPLAQKLTKLAEILFFQWRRYL
jgi:hypothetical protein